MTDIETTKKAQSVKISMDSETITEKLENQIGNLLQIKSISKILWRTSVSFDM